LKNSLNDVAAMIAPLSSVCSRALGRRPDYRPSTRLLLYEPYNTDKIPRPDDGAVEHQPFR